jgi:hypothetical protein
MVRKVQMQCEADLPVQTNGTGQRYVNVKVVDTRSAVPRR